MHGCLCICRDKLGLTMLCLVRHGLTVTIDHEGDVPIYVQLASVLRARIESGELPPRRAVPSKRMLMQEFGIAGGTVDKAIDILRGEGLVRTVTGRGRQTVSAQASHNMCPSPRSLRDSARGLGPVESEQSYEFESSRVGFPSVDGRRPSSAAWRIGCT